MLMEHMQYRVILLLTALSVGGAGCGLLGSSADRHASLTVSNLSDFTICGVHARPHVRGPDSHNRRPEVDIELASTSWGEDLLAPEETLEPGYMQTFPMDAGRYDVRFSDCRGRALWARQGLLVTGTQSVEFRPVHVERPEWYGRRRIASQPAPRF